MAYPVAFDILFRRDNLLNPDNDPNIGSSRGNASSTTSDVIDDLGLGGNSTSLSSFLTTLIPALLIAAFWFGLFLICRRTQLRCERAPQLPSGFVNWFGQFLRISDAQVLRHSSMDGYLFLRFLRVLSATCFTGCVITWPILLPINATGGAGNTQLDALSFSNVQDPTRYYAHTVMAIIFFTFVFFVVTRESIFYANLRQAYFNSPAYAERISSRTVLFMSVPEEYKNEETLRQVFGNNINRIWITSECKELDKKVQEREKLAFRLENAETKLIRAANSARLKDAKKGVISSKTCLNSETCVECESGSSASYHGVRRPTHRVKMFGKKVDTIRWLRAELAKIAEEIQCMQTKHKNGEMKNLSAVFIEFSSQNDAQVALQTLSHHQPLHMTPRYIGISPDEVVWGALNLSWWQRIVRRFSVQGGLAALVVFWSIPSAMVGTISNISYLTNLVPFLGFINKLPDLILGLISGLLPSAALALLMSLVPIICRACARCAGVPSTSRVELFTQSAHFCFQVVQVFLVTTLTSAASAATAQIIQNPLSAKDLLAENLPKATNFYISYFLLQGLTMSSMALVQVASAVVFKFITTFFDRTPRRLYRKWAALSGIGWGNVFPVFTNMGVIAITYSCIAPLILGFAFLGLYLVYQAYRYNFLFVYDLRIDTKGLVYPRALQHLLTGIYLADICLIGLFAIKGAIGPLIIMALFLIATILAHISLNDALEPLYSFLPRTLDVEEIAQRAKLETDALPPSPPLVGKWESAWKWFHPNLYRDYAALRGKVPRDHVEIRYTEEERNNAYYEPCITARTPTIWIPRDKWGFSRQEVLETDAGIPITDEGAHLSEKNRIVWDKYDPKLPLWELKILY
ncbi:DUF221-domain-containing protein [Aspergillus heteromorphus CBS 117.55]|uniref:DUF221-domain-containing protein n=1 Tax=Aspergillus heteromorphus CBS 117.55 TaxID=1448321 RepID=A0A317X1N9_9EURO|nr:DUF221-domain-containing protein [Aspergillus heteromorphus CBS 117.55]PWY92255.1 DUF221-domain-containing protein [Aspergillus heteromorphus CBS 117.55]